MNFWNTNDTDILLGVSHCLLGENVRYDGGHKRDFFLTDTLAHYVRYLPICPEVECGLGVPRESMRLVRQKDTVALLTRNTEKDHTQRIKEWAHKRLDAPDTEELCGFILKSKSPSCGMERVKVYSQAGIPAGSAAGFFAQALQERFPLLPMEEDGRLHDPVLRENFIDRIFVLRRYRAMLSQEPTLGGLVTFHTVHKLQLLAHSPKHYKSLGKLVANAHSSPLQEIFTTYHHGLMEALCTHTTPGKHVNVLQHIFGYFKKNLLPKEKQEMANILQQYIHGNLPLIVPVTLLSHYVLLYEEIYLQEQTYLHPHPVELKLRNHV